MMPDAVPGPRRRALLLVTLGFGFLSVYFTGIFPPFANPNELSRFQTAVAIAEHGTFAIDAVLRDLGDHEDKAISGGRHYSNKAPGLAFAALPVYRLLRLFLPAPSAGAMNLLFCLVRILTVSTVCAFALWRFGRRLEEGPGGNAAALVCFALAFGTPYLFYARTLFGHAWVAALLLLAWDRLKGTETPMAGRRAALQFAVAGLLGGWALITEYTVAPIVLFLAVRATAGRSWKTLFLFTLGAALPVGLLLAYQAICFGSPFLPSYAREAYPAYAELARRKFFGLELPSPEIALRYLFDPARGVLLFSPFLLWSLAGFVIWWRSGQRRADCLLALAATVSLFLLLSGYPNWHGGWSLGSRYLLPGLFFVGLALPHAISRPLSRGLFAIAALFAVAVHLLLTSSYPHFPLELAWPPANGSLWFLSRGWMAPNLLSLLGLNVVSLIPAALATIVAGGLALAAARPLSPRPVIAAAAAAAALAATCWLAPRPQFVARLWRAAVYGAFSGRDPRREELRRVALSASTPRERRQAVNAWRTYGPPSP
jgi:hypothetical protein